MKKKMVVAFALALVPLASSTALAVSSWPTICFEFAFWKYCI
jgi:hypothetical protein